MNRLPHKNQQNLLLQPKRASLFGLPLDVRLQAKDVILRMGSGQLLLSYLNPYSYKVSIADSNYVANLKRFDFVVCDGIGIRKAAKSVWGLKTPIISLDYSGIGNDYLQMCADEKMSLCLVGAREDIVRDAASNISKKYSNIGSIQAFSGYGESLIEAEKFILGTSPDMVVVCLGMGKQEAYLLKLVESGWAGIGICAGGFFDKIANPKNDYPVLLEKLNLRFLGRLVKEPRRMTKRYFIDYQPFMKLYIKNLLSTSKKKQISDS